MCAHTPLCYSASHCTPTASERVVVGDSQLTQLVELISDATSHNLKTKASSMGGTQRLGLSGLQIAGPCSTTRGFRREAFKDFRSLSTAGRKPGLEGGAGFKGRSL